MDNYRFEGIQDVVLNGKDCRLFRAYRLDSGISTEYELTGDQGAYVFCGQFTAPTGTPEKDLHRYVGEGVQP